MSKFTYVALLVLALVVSGCGASTDGARTDGASPGGADATADSTTSSAAAPTPRPSPRERTVEQWCPGLETDGVTQELVTTSQGAEVMTLRVGSGPTTVLLAHQTNNNGACGFLFFAQQLAGDATVIAVDACGFGRTSCESNEDTPAVLVELADTAREAGAERVALVGASMGGSQVVTAAAQGEFDAVVDLSGPAQIGESDITVDAAKVTEPLLVVISPDDAEDLEAVRGVWDEIPAKEKKLIEAESGHGYDFLRPDDGTKPTEVGTAVIDWALGR